MEVGGQEEQGTKVGGGGKGASNNDLIRRETREGGS